LQSARGGVRRGHNDRDPSVQEHRVRVMFSPELVNEPFGDPGLFVDFNLEHRALLFDLGELGALPPKKLLRISDVFVSHTHMDHFCGFDHLLRLALGRPTSIRLYGPPGFAEQVAHKLAAYTWNLVENYPGDFFVEAWDVAPDGAGTGVRLRCRQRFRPEPLAPVRFEDGVLRDEPAFRVRAAVLDHGIPCLAFAVEEKVHVNVWKNRVAELGLAIGPWLKTLKDAVLRGEAEDSEIVVTRADGSQQALALGGLKREVLQLVPGEKICYVTDVGFTPGNVERIARLAADASQLFIECTFLEEDAAQAAAKRHLTARQAGEIARIARARRVIPFHFSPRYMDRDPDLRAQVAAAFNAPASSSTAAR
jgi:ribonuclease Z